MYSSLAETSTTGGRRGIGDECLSENSNSDTLKGCGIVEDIDSIEGKNPWPNSYG